MGKKLSDTGNIIPIIPKRFMDKFIFIKTEYDLESRANLLMQYLSEIHLKYTSDKCYIWIEAMGGTIEGNYKLQSININASFENQITTLTHEIAHFIDFHELAGYKRSMSPICKQ